MKPITYNGDLAFPFDPQTGNGLIGKVLGPSASGQYFVVSDAHYDALTDSTEAQFEPLRDPNFLLEEMLGDSQ